MEIKTIIRGNNRFGEYLVGGGEPCAWWVDQGLAVWVEVVCRERGVVWVGGVRCESLCVIADDREPLTPTYIAPRLAPKPPAQQDSPAKPSFKAGFNSVFNRKPPKAPSLHSAYSTSTATSSSETHSVHPYSAVPMGPLPVVSSHTPPDDDDECPVCLEPLSFSFRLPGEKPHIVPECGHALHEACFVAVYGPHRASRRAAQSPEKPTLALELAALTGMGDSRAAPLYPGRDTPTSRARQQQPARPYDPNEDDPLDHTGSVKSNPTHDHAQYIVAPSIQVRPEFSSLTRTSDVNQPLTCIVVIELPGRRAGGHVPGPVLTDNYGRNSSNTHSQLRADNSSGHSSPLPERQTRQRQDGGSPRDYPSRQLSANYGPNTLIHSEEDSPFTAITEDLRNRIIDWKGHPLSDLGPLQMYDLLHVRRDSAIREFYVYLFKEAIICVVEEKKPSLNVWQAKGVLRLKGRIYVRHIKNVTASSAAGEMSLTIDMEDELASFILIFKERSSLEAWKNNIQALVNMFQAQNGMARRAQEPERPLDMEEFGGSAKAMRMLSGSTQTTVSTVDSLLNGSSRSSATSHSSLSPAANGRPNNMGGAQNKLATLDLILVISLPPPTALPSTAQLKIRVIKATLDFLVASLGPKDRLSLVTFEVGVGGRVRKCPFLSIGKTQSRQRLEKFIDELGLRQEEHQDEFLVRGSKDEKTDVGLDVVLQRKARNPVDASDSTRRAQMDLVLARAEAANVPIHSFGYGRSHDPASLWLMSNHTSGTYTFVKDWYDLRDCIAGCVGGMMSIGLLNMKLHLKIVDSHRFRIRKVSGGPQSILSADGQNVDVDVGELRYGERKEMLIELELDNTDQQKLAAMQRRGDRSMNATDQFVQAMGLDSLAIDDADFADGMMDRMIDEVPVVEVDGSFFDPAAAKNVSRLAHPVLLTITLLPLSTNSQRPQSTVSDPVIVRRRMELLASDMITRALVLVSRRNFPQAQRIMGETKRILHTVLQSISRSLPASNGGHSGSGTRNRKELLTVGAVRAMQSILQDLQLLSEALEDNVELFAHDQRNFGAQQAMILRDQKSWSGRSATERLFWTTDNSIELVSRSTDWVARE
ncbi:hypothetical protein BJ912DRAFT_1019224 [Pholiota molesta]|nr:hypothetical protein BJ912DRAFT_1019224 [Pholiota molesta]